MKKGCIIGYGAVAPNHAAALYEAGRLYGICDINSERLSSCKYPNIKTYSDIRQVLDDSSIDVIHICTPHYLHAQMATDALSAGKHVVLEKPVTMTRKELDSLSKKAADSDKKICVMLQNRTNRSIRMLKKICDEKTYGNIISCCAFLTWYRDTAYYNRDEWRGRMDTEGGGLLINQAIHLIDLCGYICGGIKSVRGSISAKTLYDVIETEDTADAVFETNSGARVCFYATNCYTASAPMRLEVAFKDVTFRYSDNNLYKITNDSCEIICSDNKSVIGKSYWGMGHKNVINSFYDYLESKTGSYISLQDSQNSMHALFAFYESAKTNKTIVIEED